MVVDTVFGRIETMEELKKKRDEWDEFVKSTQTKGKHEYQVGLEVYICVRADTPEQAKDKAITYTNKRLDEDDILLEGEVTEARIVDEGEPGDFITLKED